MDDEWFYLFSVCVLNGGLWFAWNGVSSHSYDKVFVGLVFVCFGLLFTGMVIRDMREKNGG